MGAVRRAHAAEKFGFVIRAKIVGVMNAGVKIGAVEEGGDGGGVCSQAGQFCRVVVENPPDR